MEKTSTVFLAQSFLDFVKENPDLRFWQALSSWSKNDFLLSSKELCPNCKDTFYINNEQTLNMIK